jgi:uncharacterized membrane protein
MRPFMQTCLAIALLLGDAVFFYTLRWEQVHESGSATTTRAPQMFWLGVFYELAFLIAVFCLWLLQRAFRSRSISN